MSAIAERFWSKVDKSGGSDACWIWAAGRGKTGYGRFWAGGKTIGAHRYAFLLVKGPIQEGLCVLHSCDNPACVRPDHLWLGTDADNMQDKTRKARNNSPRGERNGSNTRPDRRPRGERNGMAKLNERQVQEIRNLYATKLLTQQEIALTFGVVRSHISAIVAGKKRKQENC